jgi:hypothetical protein
MQNVADKHDTAVGDATKSTLFGVDHPNAGGAVAAAAGPAGNDVRSSNIVDNPIVTEVRDKLTWMLTSGSTPSGAT